MAQHFEDHIVRGIHRQAMSSGTAWPAHVVRALCEDLIRLRGTDRPWLAANPTEDEDGPRRRVLLADLLTYKRIDDAERRAVADELTAEAEPLGLDYFGGSDD